jgi:hypothetical protein
VKRLKELLVIAFSSAIVGGLVSLPIALIVSYTPSLDALRGAGVGALIGPAAHLSFVFFYRHLSQRRHLGLLLIATVIGLGTCLGAFALGVRQAAHFAILVSLAEAAGLAMAALGYRRYERLNDSLRKVQGRMNPEAGEK